MSNENDSEISKIEVIKQHFPDLEKWILIGHDGKDVKILVSPSTKAAGAIEYFGLLQYAIQSAMIGEK